MPRKYYIVFAGLLCAAHCYAGSLLPALDSAWNRVIAANFRFLPEYHLEADLYVYFFPKDSFFQERHCAGYDPRFFFSLISFRNSLFFQWDFDFEFGMGQTQGNIVFDPMDAFFGIQPIIELRRSRLIAQTGIEHRCYHEIDSKLFPTVYLNKLFVAVGSPNFRLSEYRTGLINREWTPENRFSWYFRWGYFLKEFLGIISPGKINGNNEKIHELSADVRYAFYRRRSWIVNVRCNSTVGWYDTRPGSAAYWRTDYSLESNLRSGIRGGMVFVQFTLDDVPGCEGLPRFSKNRLVQAGIRFYD